MNVPMFDSGADGHARRRSADGDPIAARGWSRRELLTLRRRRAVPDGRWRLEIDAAACSDCGACVRICPQEAITRTEASDSVIYSSDAQHCDGCADCGRACAERALKIARVVEPGGIAELVHLSIMICSRCGRRAAGLIEEFCAVCRQDDSRLGGSKRISR